MSVYFWVKRGLIPEMRNLCGALGFSAAVSSGGSDRNIWRDQNSGPDASHIKVDRPPLGMTDPGNGISGLAENAAAFGHAQILAEVCGQLEPAKKSEPESKN
ncbi:hypothetical protein AB0I98_27385 [Streptomyces sp. NPDC050211]|uniref:hypothetical protein n=1 Tax=Streptomyces sp. NPDC050211 TaxID=3154932 RepID=UPI00341B00D7